MYFTQYSQFRLYPFVDLASLGPNNLYPSVNKNLRMQAWMQTQIELAVYFCGRQLANFMHY